jgi:hypothetical protein
MVNVFLVKDGIVANIILIEDVAFAQKLFPDFTVVERTEDNAHINPGDLMP